MQNRARVGIESDNGWDCASRARPFDHGTHDQLVAQVQAIKHAQRQDRWSLNFSVISSVKKSHQLVTRAPYSVEDEARFTIFHFSFAIYEECAKYRE